MSLTDSKVFYYILIFFILIYCFIKTIFSFHIIFINKVVFLKKIYMFCLDPHNFNHFLNNWWWLNKGKKILIIINQKERMMKRRKGFFVSGMFMLVPIADKAGSSTPHIMQTMCESLATRQRFIITQPPFLSN